jgi:NAD(P)-dependent dehydrogenase (short-subunit alcohol dehydrogenase family)
MVAPIAPDGRLAGKVTAVTGATSGSGRAVACRFAAEGAHVFLLARGADRLRELASALGSRAVGIPVDVGEPDSVRAAFGQIGSAHGKLDVLVNNAAVYRPCPVADLTDDEIIAQVRTNYLGPVYTCRAAIPLLRAAGGGDIVNTSSEVTLDPLPHMSLYSSSKAALEAFTRTLMIELIPDDIRVTNLVQGVAIGEGGGSTSWHWDPDKTAAAMAIWESQGYISRVTGAGRDQTADQVADVHVFIVTRPRGQRLDTIFSRSY